jgi:hypothetical protein
MTTAWWARARRARGSSGAGPTPVGRALVGGIEIASVCAVVPSIPPRSHLRARALASIRGQDLQDLPEGVGLTYVVKLVEARLGAATTRNALQALPDPVDVVAFCDDDDYWASYQQVRNAAISP